MREPDLRYHGEESPTVEPEGGTVSERSSCRLSERTETNHRCGFEIGIPAERPHWYSRPAPESVVLRCEW